MSLDISSLMLVFLVFAVVLGGYLLIARKFVKRKQSADLTQRISTNQDLDYQISYDQDEDDQSINHEKSSEVLDRILAAVLSAIGKNAQVEFKAIRKKMAYAGIRSQNAPSYYLAYKFLVSPLLIVMAIPIVLGLGSSETLAEDLLIIIFLAFFGGFGHLLYVSNRTTKRQKQLTRSFPDMLDLMLVCVESGLALDASIARVCKELGAAHPLLTEELNRTRMELSLFSDRSKAFYGLGERTNVSALKALSAALIQSEKFGTSLGDTLRVLADDYRQTRLLIAEEKAAKLPALMTLPLILLLLPALFIILLAPAIIPIMGQGGIMGGGN